LVYVPILAWDFNILAGAAFSSLLSNAVSSNPSVSCNELLQSSKNLLVGRLIQVLSTPGGFLTSSKGNDEPIISRELSGWQKTLWSLVVIGSASTSPPHTSFPWADQGLRNM